MSSGWIELFNGKELKSWKPMKSDNYEWEVGGGVPLKADDAKLFDIQPGEGIMVNGPTGRTSDILTDSEHGDCELHIEFVVSLKSNSGVYFMGNYEVQILDSWGETELKYGTCGGIYCRWFDEKPVDGTPPRSNASRRPGEWQEYDIIFRAPKFDAGGNKTRNACFEKVVWNGEVVHENVELLGPTRGSMTGADVARGPLRLQGDHGPVAYRNVKLKEL
ncbi:MAG: DUF1080 domain-containing protein [Planctomycetota bacterium]|nr:DUF1080 domain-containing protein [Planctomycetota bacterium]